MHNSIGNFYRTTTFGESHGSGVGAILDGIPGNIKIDLNRIQSWLDRRKPGQSELTSPRDEHDLLVSLSGLQDGLTLGSPLCFMVENRDHRSGDYAVLKDTYRPSHGDWSWEKKFNIKSSSGGGRSSARETIGRVISGAVAEQVIEALNIPLEIVAWVDSVATLKADVPFKPSRAQVEKSQVRCPDEVASKLFHQEIMLAKSEGDSVGGTIRCLIDGIPAGLGEPVFSKMEAELAKAMMSLPASRSFEIGEGLAASYMRGSAHNDSFTLVNNEIIPGSNRHGGVQGGISTGLPISFRIGFKPVSTLGKDVESINSNKEKVILKAGGRHDPCVLPRAVPIVEAMGYMVVLDFILAQRARRIM